MSRKTKPESMISDSRTTLNREDSESSVSQTIEVTADSVLIKKERLGRNKYGEIFKGERVSMYSELGIQAILINEMNLNTHPKESMQFIHERTTAPVFNSPHIAKCYGLYMNPKGTQIWLVTEFLPFSVHDLIESGPLEEQQIAFIIAEVIKGLDYLHSLGICHGDVVSSQVVLSQSGEVKLAGIHLANDTLDASQLPRTTEKNASGFKDDILSLGKMAIKLVLGPQVSDEQVLAEKEIPSLLNQFSQNFRSVVTGCLQKDPKYRPTAAQLLNYSLIKKMRKVTALKDHKLLFNRCKRFKRSLTKRKSRNNAPGKNTKQLSAAPGYEKATDAASPSNQCSPGSVTSVQSEAEAYYSVQKASDLPNVTWAFGRLSTDSDADHLVQAHQRRHGPVKVAFQTVTATTDERIRRLERDSAEKVFKGTYMDNNQPVSSPCLIREINLSKLSKGAAQMLCREAVAPLFQTESPNIVKVLHAGFSSSEEGNSAEPFEQGIRLHIITEQFLDSIHSLQELGPLEEDLIAWILREVLKALNYLHSQRIAYRNMSTHNILFSVASGSLEIKLDHTHAVIDGLEAKTGSDSDFKHNLKADIWNLGIIATELAHTDPPIIDSAQETMDYSAPTLSSMYSIHFTMFVTSCLEKTEEKRPTAHELLQCSFIKGAKEMCGLESVFDLYWKHKLMKDEQLQDGEANDNSPLDDEDINVPPNVSWSFDEPLPGPSDEPDESKIILPPPPSLRNLWDQENETKDESILEEYESATHDPISPQVDQTPLTDHKHQRAQISVSTPHIAGAETNELSSYKNVETSTPVTQHLSTNTINTSTSSLPGEQQRIRSRTHPSTNEINTSVSSLPGEQQQRIRSRTHAHHRNRQQDQSRSSRPTSYISPPNLQGPAAAPWWMYPPPPWWLPSPWWLHPPPHHPMSPRVGGQYGYPPQGQWYYPSPPPPPPQWYYPMASGQHQGPPTPSQNQGRSHPPLWRYPPSPWQRPQPHLVPQQPSAAAGESQTHVQHGVSSFEAKPVPQHQVPKENLQHHVASGESQELPPLLSTAKGYSPQHEVQHVDHKELPSISDHTSPPAPLQEQLLTHEQLPVWQSKTVDHSSTKEDSLLSEVPLQKQIADDQSLQHEELLAHEQVTTWNSKVDNHLSMEDDHLLSEVPLLEPMADDKSQQQEEFLLREEEPLVEKAFPQHTPTNDQSPQRDNAPVEIVWPMTEEHDSIVEQECLPAQEEQSTNDDHSPLHEQPWHKDGLLLHDQELQQQKAAESLPQHREDNLGPPQLILDDVHVQHEEDSLLEAPPMQLTLKEEIIAEEPLLHDLPQHTEDHLELYQPQPILDNFHIHHEDLLLEASPMQLTVNGLVLEEKAKTEMKPNAESLLQHEENQQELHQPQPILDNIQVQHKEPLLEVSPMQLTANDLVLEEEKMAEESTMHPTADTFSQLREDHLELHPLQPRQENLQLEVLPMQPTADDSPLPEEEATVEVPLLQPTTDSPLQHGEDRLELHPLKPILDDVQVRHEEPLLDAPPMQLIVDNLVPEGEVKDEAPLLQPIEDSLTHNMNLDDIQRQEHENVLLEATPMQLTANDNSPQEDEPIGEVSLLQSTADNLSQHGEDHLELHPPQPIINDVRTQHEEPLLEATPTDMIANANPQQEEETMAEVPLLQPVADSLRQNTDLNDIQRHEHEDLLLEALPMQLTADYSPLPEKEVMVKVPLLQPTTDNLLQHGEDHLELYPPQPIIDDVQVQHKEPLLEAPPMQLIVDNLVPEGEVKDEAPLLQPIDDSLTQNMNLNDIQRQEHENILLEATSMQLTANDNSSQEDEAIGEASLLQPTTDNPLQHGENHPELQPPQPIINDVHTRHEEPLLEARLTEIIANSSPQQEEETMAEVPLLQPIADSLQQNADLDDIQRQAHEDLLLEALPMQLTADDSPLPEEEAVVEAPLLQPTTDTSSQHGEDHLELYPPKAVSDGVQVQHEEPLLEAPPMQRMANNLVLEEEVMTEDPILQPTADSFIQLRENHLDPPQPTTNDSPQLEDEVKDEAHLLQPTANDQSSSHQEHQGEHEKESHSPQPMKEAEANVYTLQELTRASPLEEHQIATVLLKVVQILDDFHSHGKVHNDVTIAHITLSESGVVKLEEPKVVESVLQMVPEVNQLIADDHKADIWSLGITAVEIASGEPPDANMLELLFGNSFITPQFLDDDVFSEEFEDFIGCCLKSDPDERSSAQELLEHTFLTSASPDMSAVTNTLISHYNDWKETLPQPAASDLPEVQGADADLELQPSAPEHDKPAILHDATISETPLLSTLPATDHHLPQQDVMAEDSLLQAIADNQSSIHEDIHYELSTTDKDHPSQHEEDPVIKEAEITTDDHSLAQQHDSLMDEFLPVLQSIADSQTVMKEDLPQHEDNTTTKEAEPVIDEHPPQQRESLVAESLPTFQSTADTHTVMEEDPPQHEEDAAIEEEPVIDDHSPQQYDSLVAEFLPTLQSLTDIHTVIKEDPPQHEDDTAIKEAEPNHSPQQQHISLAAELLPMLESIAADTHSVVRDPPQHKENAAIEEAEPTIDDHPTQQHESRVAEPLPVLQSIADSQTVMKEDPLSEAQLVQSTPDDDLSLPLQENQLSQEEQEKDYSLQELMKPQPLEEHQIATILLKVVQILDDLHSQGKVHKDVAIANISLSESGVVKLEEPKVVEPVLQMVSEVDQFIADDHKADIWSLGITAVEIASGEPPDANMLELLFGNSFITPQFLDDEKFSEEFEDFISNCLKSDPEERSSTQELLQHDFLSSASPDICAVTDHLISQYKNWTT